MMDARTSTTMAVDLMQMDTAPPEAAADTAKSVHWRPPWEAALKLWRTGKDAEAFVSLVTNDLVENTPLLQQMFKESKLRSHIEVRKRMAEHVVKLASGETINCTDECGDQALHRAAYKVVPSLVRLLADHPGMKPSTNEGGDNALFMVIAGSRAAGRTSDAAECIEILAQRFPWQLSAVDRWGMTALHWCGEVSSPLEVFTTLVECVRTTNRRVLNAFDHRGYTPIHWLVHKHKEAGTNPAYLDAMMRCGGDLHATNGASGSLTVLHVAVQHSCQSMVWQILDHEARGMRPQDIGKKRLHERRADVDGRMLTPRELALTLAPDRIRLSPILALLDEAEGKVVPPRRDTLFRRLAQEKQRRKAVASCKADSQDDTIAQPKRKRTRRENPATTPASPPPPPPPSQPCDSTPPPTPTPHVQTTPTSLSADSHAPGTVTRDAVHMPVTTEHAAAQHQQAHHQQRVTGSFEGERHGSNDERGLSGNSAVGCGSFSLAGIKEESDAIGSKGGHTAMERYSREVSSVAVGETSRQSSNNHAAPDTSHASVSAASSPPASPAPMLAAQTALDNLLSQKQHALSLLNRAPSANDGAVGVLTTLLSADDTYKLAVVAALQQDDVDLREGMSRAVEGLGVAAEGPTDAEKDCARRVRQGLEQMIGLRAQIQGALDANDIDALGEKTAEYVEMQKSAIRWRVDLRGFAMRLVTQFTRKAVKEALEIEELVASTLSVATKSM